MESLILILVFFSTVLVVLGIWTMFNRRRLAARAALREQMRAAGQVEINILRDTRKSSVGFLDNMLSQGSLAPSLEARLQRAGATWTVGEFVLAATLSALVGLLAGQQWLGNVAGFLGGILGLGLPFAALSFMEGKRKRKMEEQLPDAIDMIVNAMRAGFSFQTAMKFVGDEVPAPLGTEFTRFYDEQRLGADIRVALVDMQERVGTLDMKMFVTSLLIQRETGGNLSEVLGGLAALIRDRAALRGHIDALTAEPKFSGRVLGILPLIAFFLLSFLNPPMMRPMIETSTGHYLLAYAAISVAVGYWILMKIADIDL